MKKQNGLTSWLAVVTGIVSLVIPSSVEAQCQLANPSFELLGGGTIFGGWNQFGNVNRSVSTFTHGGQSAIVSGPFTGNWDLSAYWQRLDSAPGEVWRVAVDVGHPSSNPLNGNLVALINVEWRDGSNNLIGFDSFEVANENTPTDVMNRVEVTADPAPAGTAAVHILLAVLQSPDQESGEVLYDLAFVEEMTGTRLEDVQWDDFPGGRVINFAGMDWRVKGPGFYGPGPNQFSNSESSVWVDEDDQMHLTLRRIGNTWFSTEVTSEDVLGYGRYRFTMKGDADNWAPNVVFGLFTWQYPLCFDPANPWNLHNEIDVEISRWGQPGNDMGQFVVQPFDYPGNISRFPITFNGPDDLTSFEYDIMPDRIEFSAWKGSLADQESATPIATYSYDGPHLLRPELPRMHFNLWQFGDGPTDGQDHEAIVSEFQFIAPGEQPIPAVGSWGVLIMTLVVMLAGTLAFRREVVYARVK